MVLVIFEKNCIIGLCVFTTILWPFEIYTWLFMQPQYKESQVYLVRFKQYLSRALGLVKQHVINSLKNTTRTVMPKQVISLTSRVSQLIPSV